MKKAVMVFVLIVMAFAICAGCGKEKKEREEIKIAYQPSVGYAPFPVMKEFGLVEKYYDGELNVTWIEMNNGAAVNEGLIAGDIDVGGMGVPVAIIGIQAGGPYKIVSGLSAQPYAILSNSDDIQSLEDITEKDSIAILGINNQPYFMLAKAAKAELGDAHALDKNLTVLGNADGYSAMVSGAVTCHIVTSPFNFMELANTEMPIHEIEVSKEVWPAENTAQVIVATKDIKENSPKVYDALVAAIEEADEYIKENPKEVASILARDYDATPDEIEVWIGDERSSYETELHGVMDMAGFMVEEGFLDEGPASLSELTYDNVKGD